ncbi:MAG: hypothetical protein KKG09_05300 [Verrucomicrobia bacterium]|nr:hypothetical protein [Verrucomicrobiota bacterium]MBU4247981.1 hypothetical protein [Verrucomicrobiota bacterium]MBU4291853.1 hypothetical protein [Verrucomicrobiota bacterium]MBU4497403.1 hypothetical protein [Verrucomicrobiota bacterium]MCG2681880.1 hypothetical protein [Kiritimatiellia bacterium]
MKTGKILSALFCAGVVSTGSLLAGDGAGNAAAGTAVKGHRAQQTQERKAHFQQQKSENKEFRQGLKDIKGQDKTEAIVEHRETQYQENKGFIQTQHTENMAFLTERLANNKKLTDTQKSELTSFFESQYHENVSFRDTQHSANITYFTSVANDTSLTMDQKKAKLKAYFKSQKATTKDHIQQQQSERKAEREKIKSEFQSQKAASSAGQ